MGHVAVLGAGAWGTALAKLLAEKSNEVWIWGRPPEVIEDIEKNHRNNRYLPGFDLPRNLHATEDPERALQGANLVLLAIPSHATRGVLQELNRYIPRGVPLVSATKGIENDSLMLMHQVTLDTLGPECLAMYTTLSGPSFAKEVALRHPTVVAVAGSRREVAQEVQARFSSEVFRVYWSDDLVGVELGGALKNVIAIAAGAGDGMGFGHNSRAAVITRGLNELAKLAVAKGANPLTIAGLAGMGDLVLTCTGELSRNRTVGIELGRGKKLEDILNTLGHVAEGVKTARSAYDLARSLQVEMPITEQVYQVLYHGKSVRDALADLMRRPLLPELDFR
ncbi:MAG: NAD(P)H-dependent glycerol-3-phosphate dehydrogenase [Myxococcales bacterium]|nr:NAD(P)-dependent glycerol-3-phosphate dehydrogenase [Polyangiaceae bacterium]MDW8249619.1 NAD(P)H-dependent glycerol-3-phosphate dehydrogenase [Myxococcales bacterium]